MNNIQHLKYAVEVEKTGSISKAAKNLFMGQPHLSKAIKELEDSLGITVFNRTPQGVVPTIKGAAFLRYAKSILAQIEEMESLYKQTDETVHRFDISVPRASYVSYAFSEFAKTLESEKEIDLNYRETNSMRAIRNVAVLVGAGKLGKALLSYEGFREYSLNIVAAFDTKGTEAGDHIPGKILPIETLSDLCRRLKIRIGIITVPAVCAQEVCDILVQSGVLAIWNFAPTHLHVPSNIFVKNENMAASLAILSQHLSRRLLEDQ